MNWQPISTAPLDGTQILLYWPDLYSHPYIATGYRNQNKYVRNSRPYWCPDHMQGGVTRLRERRPSHWQPLPTLPQFPGAE
jgi:hypothetical protein